MKPWHLQITMTETWSLVLLCWPAQDYVPICLLKIKYIWFNHRASTGLMVSLDQVRDCNYKSYLEHVPGIMWTAAACTRPAGPLTEDWPSACLLYTTEHVESGVPSETCKTQGSVHSRNPPRACYSFVGAMRKSCSLHLMKAQLRLLRDRNLHKLEGIHLTFL